MNIFFVIFFVSFASRNIISGETCQPARLSCAACSSCMKYAAEKQCKVIKTKYGWKGLTIEPIEGAPHGGIMKVPNQANVEACIVLCKATHTCMAAAYQRRTHLCTLTQTGRIMLKEDPHSQVWIDEGEVVVDNGLDPHGLTRPKLEFMLTDKFGFINTGYHNVSDLKATTKGKFVEATATGTQGKAIQVTGPDTLLFTGADHELDFVGGKNPESIESFTFAFYMKGNNAYSLNLLLKDELIKDFINDVSNSKVNVIIYSKLRIDGVKKPGKKLIPFNKNNPGWAKQQVQFVHNVVTYDAEAKKVQYYIDGKLAIDGSADLSVINIGQMKSIIFGRNYKSTNGQKLSTYCFQAYSRAVTGREVGLMLASCQKGAVWLQ